MRLVNPSRTGAVLRKSGFRFKRALGQNFLIDANTLDRILAAADLKPDDIVLEVGTGIGTLTLEMAGIVKGVVTVEVDRRLESVLDETLAPAGNIARISKDAMDLTADDLGFFGRPPNKMVANLPYSIAAPVVIEIFSMVREITEMVVMVQKEIAERMSASPGSRDYSAFTAKLAYFCRAEKIMPVSRRAFTPVPNVDSAVVKLTRRRNPPTPADRDKLFSLVTAGFSQRRKKLVNSLSGAAGGKPAVTEALDRLGLSPDSRAENLSIVEFGRLAAELENNKSG